MLLLPLPVDCRTTGPPSTCGPANGQADEGAGARVGSRIAADGSSKCSRQSFVEKPARAIQRFDSRLTTLNSKPVKLWWYPGRFADSLPPPGGTALRLKA